METAENENKLEYELENKNIKLAKFSTQKIELYVQVFKEGKINIKGVELSLGNCGIVRHFFNKKNKVNLYKYASITYPQGRVKNRGRPSLVPSCAESNFFRPM